MIASILPLVWSLGRCARRRRIDTASVIVVGAYAAAVGLSLLFGSDVGLEGRDGGDEQGDRGQVDADRQQPLAENPPFRSTWPSGASSNRQAR